MEPQSDLSLQLPRDVFYTIVHTLRRHRRPMTDSPEDVTRRDNDAIAQVATLLPANADEAHLGALYVTASTHADECMLAAREFRDDTATFIKLTAQARGMLREARALRVLLQRVQAERQKREADARATEQAAWTEHCAAGLMADALGRAAPEPAPKAEPADALAVEADQYAIAYPGRAALIRRSGGSPEPCDFALPRPALVHAIATGTSPTLQALDRQKAEPAPA